LKIKTFHNAEIAENRAQKSLGRYSMPRLIDYS